MQRLMLEELTATLALEDVAHNYLDRMAILKNHCRCGDLSLHWRAVNAYEPFFGGWHFGAHDLKLERLDNFRDRGNSGRLGPLLSRSTLFRLELARPAEVDEAAG